MYVYACMYVGMYVCRMSAGGYECVHVCVYVYVRMLVCMRVVGLLVDMSVHVCLYAYVCMLVCV